MQDREVPVIGVIFSSGFRIMCEKKVEEHKRLIQYCCRFTPPHVPPSPPACAARGVGTWTLHIEACDFTSLPSSLGQLQGLCFLHLQECPAMTELPCELGELSSLEGLKLSCMPAITSLPDSLASQCSRTLSSGA